MAVRTCFLRITSSSLVGLRVLLGGSRDSLATKDWSGRSALTEGYRRIERSSGKVVGSVALVRDTARRIDLVAAGVVEGRVQWIRSRLLHHTGQAWGSVTARSRGLPGFLDAEWQAPLKADFN
jgi:hypothetical protein